MCTTVLKIIVNWVSQVHQFSVLFGLKFTLGIFSIDALSDFISIIMYIKATKKIKKRY